MRITHSFTYPSLFQKYKMASVCSSVTAVVADTVVKTTTAPSSLKKLWKSVSDLPVKAVTTFGYIFCTVIKSGWYSVVISAAIQTWCAGERTGLFIAEFTLFALKVSLARLTENMEIIVDSGHIIFIKRESDGPYTRSRSRSRRRGSEWGDNCLKLKNCD